MAEADIAMAQLMILAEDDSIINVVGLAGDIAVPPLIIRAGVNSKDRLAKLMTLAKSGVLIVDGKDYELSHTRELIENILDTAPEDEREKRLYEALTGDEIVKNTIISLSPKALQYFSAAS